MYKIVFIDLDGTLLRRDHSISEETRKTIQKLRDKGIKIILVSARPYHGIVAIHAWLGIGEFPVASLNGSYITSLNEVIFTSSIPQQTVDSIHELIGGYRATMLYYSGLQWFSEIKNSATDKEQLITPVQVITMPYADLQKRWKEENISMNKLMAVGTEANIRNLQSRLMAEFGDVISAYTSKPTYLEIMPKSASKAEAARFMLNMYNISREESIALGDNYNDKEMLIFAGKGIAMGNAPEEIKAAADDITDTNQHDGVRKALEKWL